jgi:hypothetical protein
LRIPGARAARLPRPDAGDQGLTSWFLHRRTLVRCLRSSAGLTQSFGSFYALVARRRLRTATAPRTGSPRDPAFPSRGRANTAQSERRTGAGLRSAARALGYPRPRGRGPGACPSRRPVVGGLAGLARAGLVRRVCARASRGPSSVRSAAHPRGAHPTRCRLVRPGAGAQEARLEPPQHVAAWSAARARSVGALWPSSISSPDALLEA